MAKTPNYTTEMETVIRDKYLTVRSADQDTRDAMIVEIVDTLRNEFDAVKEPKSVISKLSRMFTDTGEQLYVKKVTVSKATGEAPVKKIEMAVKLAELVNSANPDAISGRKIPRLNPENVEKLNKSDIQALQVFAESVTSD
jgi:hypothetical protein